MVANTRNWEAERDEFLSLATGISLANMRSLRKQDLVYRYDRLMMLPVHEPIHGNSTLTPDDYLAELHRRENEERIVKMEILTKWICAFTFIVTILTAVSTLLVWKSS